MAETTTLKSRIKHAYKTEADWTSSDPVLYAGEIGFSSDKGNMYKVGDGTSKWSALSYNKSDTANTATKLATARTIQTNLASDSTASFDGSANVTPGVTGVLPVANGGTGNSSVDTTPTDGSTKMVTSGGIYTALSGKQDLIPAWADSMGTNSITLNHKNAAFGDYACAEGYCTYAVGKYSHAEGYYTTAFGISSHSEGGSTGAALTQIGSLGTDTTNSDIITAWDRNKFSLAKGNSSHVEGKDCLALGDYSHAEGSDTTASGNYSHAEGYQTVASGNYSHAEGLGTTASSFSHAEGTGTTASSYSHAEGSGTIASSYYQHVQGKYNIEDTSSTYAHIVGNGTADDARSNAYTLDWDGNGWYAGDVLAGGELLSLGGANIIGKVDMSDDVEIHSNLTVTSDLAVNGSINSSIITGTYLAGNQGTAIINSTAGASNFVTLIRRKSTNGVFQLYGYNNTIGFTYTDDTTISAGTNGAKYYVHLLKEDGNSSFPGTVYSVLLNGTKNCPLIGTTATADNQVAYINSYAKNISIGGKWGGSSFASRNLTVSSSDIRLKENINNTEITDALSVINKISMHSFDWKDTNAHQSIGFIADELEEIDPHLAIGGGYDDDGSMNVKSVDTFYLLGYLTKGIQELSKENNNLREEIQNLKSLMAS